MAANADKHADKIQHKQLNRCLANNFDFGCSGRSRPLQARSLTSVRYNTQRTIRSDESAYLRDGRVDLETVGQGLSSFWLESVVGDINLFDMHKSRADGHEAASSSTSNQACKCFGITSTPQTRSSDTTWPQTRTNARIRFSANSSTASLAKTSILAVPAAHGRCMRVS